MENNNDDKIEENLNIEKEIQSLNNNNNINLNTNGTPESESKLISNNNTNITDSETKNELNSNNNIINEESEKTPLDNKTEPTASKKIKEEIKEKKDYKAIIKEYLKQSLNDPKYEELINTNPMALFDTINEEKIKEWESVLSSMSPNTKKIKNIKNEDILTFVVDLDQLKIIKNDCKRTRVKESIVYPDFVQVLEKVLTFYCYKYKASYKQGLNEIFGPLVLMQHKIKNFSLIDSINLGAMIVDSFLPNYFYEREIYSLKSAFGLFIILLKYHEPTVYNKFDKLDIRPEIYATSWLVNYMSGKVNLYFFYELWDQMINSRDPLFIEFVLVAVIKYNRELLINCEECILASFITCLTIKTKDELLKIVNIAKELRTKTPYSFRILANKIGFLKKNYKDIKAKYELFQPQSLPAMPIFPSEVLFITYKSEIDCIDPTCQNYIKSFEAVSPELRLKNNVVKKRGESRTVKEKNRDYNFSLIDKNHLCEKCDMKIEKKMEYILLDLRILQYDENEDDSDKTGFLPKMIAVSQEELKSEDFSNIMTNRFITERGNYHFIFLTTTTDTFSNFEANYYMDNVSEEDKKKMLFGIIKQQKIDKELDIDNAMKTLTLKQTFKLKEYDNMRKLLNSMIKHNFPYVGYVYGGFNDVHKESKLFKVELVNHNEDTCLLCNGKAKPKSNKKEKEDDAEISELYKSLWEHKKKIKYKNLDVFFKNPNNKMHLCILKEYKNKNIENEQVQILINELFDKFEIEIYKFDKQKQYQDFENTIMIMNKKEKKKYYDLGKDDNDLDEDLELTLLEKVSVVDVISINANHKSNNIVNVTIRNEDKKDGLFGLFKKKDNNVVNHTIVFDFSSSKDSKNFISSFKSLIQSYREKLKNK
jgi:hypothetical protein